MKYDVIVIGAGAAGLMCAAQASYRGRQVLTYSALHLIFHRKIIAPMFFPANAALIFPKKQ
jgi:predicted flavoprotein YhiN